MRRRSLLKSLAATAASVALAPSPAFAEPRSYANAEILQLEAQGSVQSVLMNQTGFQPARQKHATVVFRGAAAGASAPQKLSFLVRNLASDAVVLHGTLSSPAADAASGDTTCQADLSALQHPGEYQLEAAGVRSDPFPIHDGVYADALRLAMRGFYGQRCGCAVDLGDGYKHVKCHVVGGFHPSSGRSGSVPNTGGWHDAGDYGRYTVNSGISTGTLLWAWELYPGALQQLALDLPESGNGTPDFLSEIRWNLNWMLSMQDATDGGVWQKQTSEHFCAFIMPGADTLPSEIIGTGAPPYKNTCATADLAAVAAIAARCYKPFDAAFADRCLAAARHAWTWVVAHPDVTFRNPPGITTGEYGDSHCGDERLWAAAELFATTREPEYERAFLSLVRVRHDDLAVTSPSWNNLAPMALWRYCLTPHTSSAALVQQIKDLTRAAALQRMARSQANGYGNTLALPDYRWGSNSVVGNDALLLLIAHLLAPDQALVERALDNLHYLLGRNCFGVSWLTQVGRRPFQNPHHRPSFADGIAAPWPGLLSGGPNAHGGDAIANQLPSLPPMRSWVDDHRAYSLNEIAINWNAPLVFLLAAVNDTRTT